MGHVIVLENMDAHACHRLDGHKGKCKFLHGHTYRIDVALEAHTLDDMDMVVDFGDVKKCIKTWIDNNFDHAFIYDENDPVSLDILKVLENFGLRKRTFKMSGKPTAENMSNMLYDIFDIFIEQQFGYKGVRLIGVKVWETPKAYAMRGTFTE